MGYESRIYIGLRHHYTTKSVKVTTEEVQRDYTERLGIIDLSKMGYDGFNTLFDKEVDFDIYKEDGNTLVEEDSYGDICKYTTINPLYKYLKEEIKKGETYRRLFYLYDIVKSFKKNRKQWEYKSLDGSYDKIVFIHWGY